MALNIKNPDAEKLTKELAQLTGETATKAVTEAVRERLERLRAYALAKSKRAPRLFKGPDFSHTDVTAART
jgi:antitoxin VapB